MNLPVPMSSAVPWTLNKTHIKVALRMCVSTIMNRRSTAYLNCSLYVILMFVFILLTTAVFAEL